MLDEDGTRVGEVHETEPEWDDSERMIMLAYQVMLDDTCPGCGHPLSETTDPDNEGRYVVPLPRRCFACTPLQRAFTTYEKADQPRALHFHALLRDRLPAQV